MIIYIIIKTPPIFLNFFLREEVALIQRNKHNILKDGNILYDLLPHYKDKATKDIINQVHIEKFKIDIIQLIDRAYNVTTDIIQDSYILFEYRDGVINRCSSYDITDYI